MIPRGIELRGGREGSRPIPIMRRPRYSSAGHPVRRG
jgi:hypothetical protein